MVLVLLLLRAPEPEKELVTAVRLLRMTEPVAPVRLRRPVPDILRVKVALKPLVSRAVTPSPAAATCMNGVQLPLAVARMVPPVV